MEAQLQAMDLDPLSFKSILHCLKEGSVLSADQSKVLFDLISHERKEKELVNVFEESPLNFLKAIDLLYKQSIPDNGENELLTKRLSRFSALLLRFVTRDNFSVVMDVCSNNMVENSIYLHLYMNIAVTFCDKSDKPVKILLPFLGTASHEVVMHVTLTLYHFLKKNPSSEQVIVSRLQTILDLEASEVSKEEFGLLTTAFEVFLPSTPKPLVPLYCSEACKSLFLYRGLILDPDTFSEDSVTAEKILKVISVSCMYDEARKFNSLHYLQFLIGGTKVKSSNDIVGLSCLCLVKIWDFITLEKKVPVQTILSMVVRLIKDAESISPGLEPLVECTIYLSLSSTLKTIIRKDKELILKLLTILDTTTTPVIRYGIIAIFSNLTKIAAPGASKEDETKNYLKNMAETQKTGQKNEDVSLIQTFNKDMVRTSLVPLLLKACASNKKSSDLVVKIVYHLTVRQSHSVLQCLGTYGSCDTLLSYLLENSSLNKDTGKTKSNSEDVLAQETRACAIKALAAIVRSLNPEELFKEYNPKISVPFLVELVDQKPEPGSFEQNSVQFSSLDLLFGLLALTNLCVIPDSELHKVVVQKTFEQLVGELIFNSLMPDIQRAAWELVNNLIQNPFMLAKFFNQENPSSRRNLVLLVKFLDSEDPALQKIIAGLMANATSEHSLVVDSLVADTDVFKDFCGIIGNILNEQSTSSDLMYRLGILLHNFLSSTEAVNMISNDAQLKTGLLKVIKNTTDNEVKMVFSEIAKTIFRS